MRAHLLLIPALAVLCLLSHDAQAVGKKKVVARWSIAAVNVDVKASLPGLDQATQELVVTRLKSALAADPHFAPVPAGAPDPKADPTGFGKAMAARKLRVFDVRIKVTRFQRKLTPVEGSKDQNLTYSVALELLGENVPSDTLGFTGAGDAEITAQVGATVSQRLDENLRQQVWDAALSKALAHAVAELEAHDKKK